MSESLGKFVIDLEARIASMESDLGRAARLADKRAREMQKSFDDAFGRMREGARQGVDGVRDAFQSLTGISPAQLGIGALVGGLGELVKKAIDTGDEINKMAQRTGIGVQALSGLAYAGSLADVQLSDLGTSLEKFAKNTAAAAGGSKDQAAAFAAMGISIKNADGSIRPLDQLLGSVATKFAGYQDGVEKTALAQQLFGKSGAAMIPLLNQGAEGMAAAAAEAKALGYNFAGITQQSEDFNDNLTKMGKAAVGLGADIARELLPSMIKAEEKILDVIKSARESGTLQSFAHVIAEVAENLDKVAVVIAARLAFSAVAAGATAFAGALMSVAGAATVSSGSLTLVGGSLLTVQTGLAVVTAAAAGWEFGRYLEENYLEAKLAGIALVDGLMTAWERIKQGTELVWPTIVSTVLGSIDRMRTKIADLLDSYAKFAETDLFTGKMSDNAFAANLAKQIRPSGDSTKEYADQIEKINAQSGKAIANIHAITDSMAGDAIAAANAAKAHKGATEATSASGDAAGKAKAPIVSLGAAVKKSADDAGAFAEKIRDAFKALDRLHALAKQWAGDTQDLKDRIAGADDAQISYNKALREANAEYAKVLELGPPTAEAMQALGDATHAAAEKMDLTRVYDAQKDAMERYRDELRKTQEMWGDFADAVFDAVSKSGNFLKNLLHNLRDVVTQMLKEWFRTRVIGMFTGQGGGGGWGALLGMGAAAMSGGASGSTGGGSAGDVVVNFATGGGGGGSSLFGNSSTWVQTGKKLWDGFQNGFSGWFTPGATSGSTIFGSYMGAAGGIEYAPSAAGSQLGLVPDYYAGAPGAAGPAVAPGSYGYTPSTFGYAAAGVAGAYAGWQRWQGSNKDFGGALGGVAYGVGTYSAAIGAGAALSGGMAAGMAAIPVVGWIALAAMAVDYLSGGKLFGTKGKLHHTNMSLDVGAEGASLAQSYTLKGQKAFFGGTKWTTESIAPSAEAQQAAQDFYDALKKNRDDFAKAFNASVGDLVGGTFSAEYDKNGNLTKSSSTVFGVTYDGETQDQFAQRLVAENQLAVLSQFDDKIVAMADSYRQNVDALTQFAAAAAMSQSAFTEGAKMLALGADQSISAMLKLAEGVQLTGETIDQTVARLLQAQQAYDQFVGQFKPATSYVDDFEGSISRVNQQMRANIAQADALARAAGAEAASNEDLLNIRKAAQDQIEQLIASLTASAQSLAYAMGLTQATTLDQINGEISALESRAGDAASAVGGFGNAMQDAARQATDAMNLLLGDLSPLNDQQKLQTALAGLQAGTVTQEQVLEIGRRLYASGKQYQDLFSTVMQFAPRGSASVGSSHEGGGQTNSGLSPSEREHLNDLYSRRDAAMAQQDYVNAQTLAQQIAEISMSKGEDYEKVIEELGINTDEFIKRLHLDNADQLKDYIANIQKQTDSAGENTTSIVDAIDRLGDRILGVNDKPLMRSDHPHGGTEPGGGKPGATGGDAPYDGGRSGGGGGRGLDSDEAITLLRRIARASESPNGPRNLRVANR